jgi:hypothetical protein
MKRKVCKPNPAPPLLCWDIYSEYLKEKLHFPAVISEEPKFINSKTKKKNRK